MPPQERIVEAARALFCRDGIHATGIERILSTAGVSKMTLYARFGSKEALLREVLRREGEDWRVGFFAALADAGPDPESRLRGVVAALGGWFRGERFYGCAFMNAVAEHTKGEPWLRALAAEHHAAVLDALESEAAAAGRPAPRLLARQILLLIDGLTAAMMVGGDPDTLAIGERSLRAILRPEADGRLD